MVDQIQAAIPLNEGRVGKVVRDTGREYCDEHKWCVSRIGKLEEAQAEVEHRMDAVERNQWKFGMLLTGINALVGLIVTGLVTAKTFGLL